MESQDSASEPLLLRDAYEAVGVHYRYFLDWRHQLFAGYLAVLAALAIAFVWTSSNRPDLEWTVFASGLVVTLLFWSLEYRNRDLFHACQRSGQICETGLPAGAGVFTRLQTEHRGGRFSHSRTMDVLFSIVGVAMLVGLIRSLLI